jgi:hypothetical protein
MFDPAKEYEKLLHIPENTWTKEILGDNLSADAASTHSTIRKIVSE